MQPEPSWLHRAREHLWLLTLTVVFLWLAASATASSTAQPTAQSSLRFFGAGIAEPGRVRVPLGPINAGRITASAPVNVSGDFTIEFWMKASAADNPAPACPNGWYYGHIIIDRDVDGAGDYGDYGIALCDGRLAAGVSVGEDDRQLVGDVVVTDGQWHHIALTRSDGGRIALFVDGAPAGSTEGPDGRVDYRVDRPTRQPDSDPYLVLGAEKHGYPGSYHYSGLLDDLRISNVARYSGPFSRPAEPHPLDAQTVALYRFDEGAGAFIGDSSNATGGPSHGTLIVRGSPAGPVWSSDTPFTSVATAPTTPGGVETALSENSE
ncbi:MAG: LamG domain-containing protein, partial [Chloroflexaceae bacterium]